MDEQSGEIFPLTLFYSYAHEDEKMRNELEKHLSLLQRRDVITTWHDRQIQPGIDWARAIDTYLEHASIILLLISPDFLASDYYYGVEVQRAIDRQRNGEAYVIPVLLRPVDSCGALFEHLQCLPSDGKSITEWSNQDAAFRDVATRIREAIEHVDWRAGKQPLSPLPPWAIRTQNPPVIQQGRKRLIKRVRSFWIEGVLEQSLYHSSPIPLELHEQPDAIENPWRLLVQEAELPERPLSSIPLITHIYDDADGELLILGEPGAGKTTLLLELARHLLDRAERDESHPIPVVFNLSSWAMKRQPLAGWLIEELCDKYRISPKLGLSLVNTSQVLPLLDGLDEVASKDCYECIVAINIYHRQNRFVPTVVCSRRADYIQQKTRLQLNCAISLQPPNPQQIDEYLLNLGEQSGNLRIALRQDPLLRELAATPLMLHIMIGAYQGQTVVDRSKWPVQESIFGKFLVIPDELRMTYMPTNEQLRKKLFAKYIQRMLKRRRVPPYTSQQMICWLSWLAKILTSRSKTQFTVEWIVTKLVKNADGILGERADNLSSQSFFLSSIINLTFAVGSVLVILILVAVFGQGIWLLWVLLTYLMTWASTGWLLSGANQYIIPRFLLWRAGATPLNYRRFLDYTAECILFRRVGNTYFFIHRLLLDYFASLDVKEVSNEKSTPTSEEKHL